MRYFDMLVKLYELPETYVPSAQLEAEKIRIFRPMLGDRKKISDFIRTNFSEVWACEFEKAMSSSPVSCFVAVKDGGEILGFSCYDASAPDFFGPIGVSERCRGTGLGRELLLGALFAMREQGYAYAVIGWSSEKNAPFYEKCANAVEIPDSFPGIFRNSLKPEE